MNFTNDPALQTEAESNGESAVLLASGVFQRVLDFSDSSISDVEFMLSVVHEDSRVREVAEEKIRGIAITLGYYVGEVFRRNHGAEWGWVESDGERFVGMRALKKKLLFWPAGKTLGRIRNGPEDNLVYYYSCLVKEAGAVQNAGAPQSPVLPKVAVSAPQIAGSESKSKSWIRRLFGA